MTHKKTGLEKLYPERFAPIDEEEVNLIEGLATLDWAHAPDIEEITHENREAHENTFGKVRGEKKISMSLRLPQKTLQSIRDRAEREGMPYQTLIVSVMHKYVNGDLIQK